MTETRGQATAEGSVSPSGPDRVSAAAAALRSEGTGRMLHVAAEPHHCRQPYGRDHPDGYGFNPLMPAGPPGSVWRCTCGQLWIAGIAAWAKATWLQRWRWRKAGRS